jgi:endonuclease/exonuclease/phosphatase family metal-dependent hydrolase
MFAIFLFLIVHSQVDASDPMKSGQETIRIATYNVSLYGKAAGLVRERLADGIDRKAANVAAVVQTVRPDILLLNEIDYDDEGETVKRFAEHFLAKSQRGLDPIDYPFIYAAPSNTGVSSKMDLDGNGRIGGPADAWGFGVYPGQYSFAVLSRFAIDENRIRTFQKFLWRDLPDAKKPINPKTGEPHYPDDVWKSLRLSSKNHVDVPIDLGGQTIHLLASHPTPPVFDGPEDRNGNRNHDEVQFWNHYISESSVGQTSSKWLVDDQGLGGGLDQNALFVIVGDLNTDPDRGDSKRAAITKLIGHPRVHDSKPVRTGDTGSLATASFGPRREMRIDYVLPSSNFVVNSSAVFWPAKTDPDYELITATDHRMVWVEVKLP